MIVYISGAITKDFKHKEKFDRMAKKLTKMRHVPLNPADMPLGMEYDDYMHIAYAMIHVADVVVFLDGWTTSDGALLEKQYVDRIQKPFMFEHEI